MAATFKSFISEKEIEEVKKKRQEEWEKVRKPNQPLERPEEVFDNRTLYERLKQQRDKKQEEWEEQFKFKNMIYKGLDDDEAGFLNFVAQRQADNEADAIQREMKEVSEYREAVAKLQDEVEISQPPTTSITSPNSISPKNPSKSSKSHKSQLSMIAGSIKTKRKRNSSSDGNEQPSQDKKPCLPSSCSREGGKEEEEVEDRVRERCEGVDHLKNSKKTIQTNTVLSGLVAYSSDSSDTED